MAKHLEARLAAEAGPKRVLALDGGGVKGVLTLGMLHALEAELRRRSGDPNLVLADYYDLIGGTSTGAIIAAGLALGKSVDELTGLYLQMGPDVFGRRRAEGYFSAKFDAAKLRKALNAVIGRRTLGTPDLKTLLAIHAKRIDTGSAWVLTNNPKSKYFDPPNPDRGVVPNKSYRLVDIVQASAAAPTYFDEVKIPIEYDQRDRVKAYGYFVDGAVSANNNPSLQLLMLALIPSYEFRWKPGPDNLMMTSFGTGLRRPTAPGDGFGIKAPAWRAILALKSMIFDTQMQGVMLMQALSEPQIPWRVNSELGDMAGERMAGTALLDFQRIDVRLEEKGKRRGRKAPEPTTVEKLLGEELPAKTLEALDDLDNGAPENMQLLLRLGRAVGPLYVGASYPRPHFDPPGWAKAPAPAPAPTA